MPNCFEVYRQKHRDLLARPRVIHTKCEDDQPEKKSPPSFKRPLVPIKSKRLDMLGEMPKCKITQKYVEPEVQSTYVQKSALEGVCTPRIDHLSRPTARQLIALRNERRHYGQSFIDSMNDKIAISFDTIYYHNLKYLRIIEASKKKPKPKGPRGFFAVGNKERLDAISKPYPVWKPPPPPPRPKMKLEYLLPNIDRLATPARIVPKTSQDSFMAIFQVKKTALTYTPTERILTLAAPNPFKVFTKRVELRAVTRGALQYVASDRIKELSEPHSRANAPEIDVKENPYAISPFALKYKATARIMQLAKPIER